MRRLLGSGFLAIALMSTEGVGLAAQRVAVDVKDGDTILKGDLYLPKAGKGEAPLVLVIPEWWGKNDYSQKRAAQIADELGYAALAVDLYGDGKTVETPNEAGALAGPFYEKPELGIGRLKKFIAAASGAAHGTKIQIDTKNVAAVGYCFGGSQALNLARGNDVKAVVALHAGLASSFKGEAKITTKVLVLHGEADPMVKPEEVSAFKDEMKKAGVDLGFVSYPGALHAFSNPKATSVGKKFGIPVAYDEKADKASWKEMATFLRVSLGK